MNEKLTNMFEDSNRVPIVVGVVSFIAGVGVGFGINHILNKRKKQSVYDKPGPLKYDEDRLEKFLSEQEAKHGITPKIMTPLTERLEEPVVIEQEPEEETITLIPDGDTEAEVGVVTHNVFAESDDDWNYEEELKSRSSEEPYVLHKDEFYADELDYTQTSLTYFAGDNIMVDEEETPVYSHEQITGPLKFGHGSGDPNVVYIRNDKRHAEYEIIRDSGLYSKEILGLTIEDNQRVKDLKHSHHVPRFYQD